MFGSKFPRKRNVYEIGGISHVDIFGKKKETFCVQIHNLFFFEGNQNCKTFLLIIIKNS
jgi:hypothetical protein